MVKANTFSIAAHCARTGQLGVAVSTAIPAVGMLCPYVASGVGAISSQSFINPYLGIWGLEYLAQGHGAAETLAYLKTLDPNIEMRQLVIVDTQGGSAAFTGKACDSWNGQLVGPNYAIAGNMLVGAATLEAMQTAFLAQPELDLADRLMLALQAGQQAGGDKRGKQSAALRVHHREVYPLVSLAVDDHADPVAELARVYQVFRETLLPVMSMLPTRENPGGAFDLEYARSKGMLQDS